MVVTLLCFDLSNPKCFKVHQLPDAENNLMLRHTNYFTQKV